jgi:hypothetical protein
MKAISEFPARATPVPPGFGVCEREGSLLPIPSFGSNLNSASRPRGGYRIGKPKKCAVGTMGWSPRKRTSAHG